MNKRYKAKITHVGLGDNKIVLKWLLLSGDLKGQEVEDTIFKSQEHKLKNLAVCCGKLKEGEPFNAYNLVGDSTYVAIDRFHGLGLTPHITHRKGEEGKDAAFIKWLSQQTNPLLKDSTFMPKEVSHVSL